MNSNGAAALLTTPGHRGPPAMSAAAAAELVEARGAARDGRYKLYYVKPKQPALNGFRGRGSPVQGRGGRIS